MRDSAAFLVGIGPPGPLADVHPQTVLHRFLPSPRRAAPEVTATFQGQDYPLLSLQNLAVLWAFTGELVGALTRLGRMPVLYQSVLVSGARQRNARSADRPFHDNHTVPAMPPGRLGEAYLEALGDILRSLAASESRAIDGVGRACADVVRAGGTVHAGLISHFPMHQHGAPGDPGHMRRLSPLAGETPSVDELRHRLRPGDLLFFLGYYRRPHEAYRVAREAGVPIVEVITGHDDAGPRPDHLIRPHWPFGDALVTVPGYDVDILPSSGIVQAAIYWAVVGAISRNLAA